VLLSAGRRLGVLTWLAAPLLFAASVLALTALGGLLIDADWHVTLSIALFGPAAAVTLVIGAGLDWMAAWQRWTIRIIYPAALFTLGLLLDRVTVPAPVAIAVGTPALITLVVLLVRDRNRQRRPMHAREELRA
jgi:hypothetical protein